MTQRPSRDLVSVIIPVFNRERLILDALDSVAAQTYRPIEVVVVDDGSSDGTHAAVSGWFERLTPDQGTGLTLTLLRQANRGAQAARNAGFEAARGEFIQFFDSDDILHPEKIRVQAEFLAAHPDVAFVYSSARGFRTTPEGDDQGGLPLIGTPHSKTLEGHLGGQPLKTDLGLYRRAVVARLGPWREDLKVWQEGEYNLRLILTGERLAFLPGVYAYYRLHEAGRISDAFASHALLHSLESMVMLIEARARGADRDKALSALSGQYFSVALHAAIRGRAAVARESVAAGLGIATSPSRRRKLQLLAALLRPGVPAQLQIGLCRGIHGLLMLRRAGRRALAGPSGRFLPIRESRDRMTSR